MKILAIDDDEFFLGLLGATLNSCGFEDTELVASAAVASKILHSQILEIDCILLDIMMPEIDGIELCRRIRRLPAYSATPVIMLTAASSQTYMERALVAGASDFVSKPLVEDELISRIHALAHIKRAA